ncbi:MAG: PspC domain-containing protein [Propionibacteriaceae bacterium]|nr:PspC domain-containing protein [Propionibacteriaceae bacterium]
MPNLPVRDRADAKIAGVSAALARAWSIDPVIVRVGFVVVALMTGGFVIAAYAVLWVVLPTRSGPAPLHRAFPSTRAWSTSTLAVAVLAASVVLGTLASSSGPSAFLILALTWVILRFGFAGRRPGQDAPAPAPLPPPVTPFERSARAWQQRLDNLDAGRPLDWDPEAVFAAPPTPTPAASHGRHGPGVRRRGLRTWLGIILVLALAGIGLAAIQLAGTPVPPVAWAATALLVFGLGLLWSARRRRAVWGRPPLLLAATLVAGVTTVAFIIPQQRAPFAVTEPVTTMTATGEVTHLPIGENTVDLTDSPATGETLTYRLDVGDLVVLVPATGNVEVRTHVDLGEIRTPDGSAEGIDAAQPWSRIEDPAAPTLIVDLAVGLGEIEVVS